MIKDDQRGETLLELLVSMVIISLTLATVLSVFMNGRAGIEQSWERTEANQCAVSVMEAIKAHDYAEVLTWKGEGGDMMNLSPFDEDIDVYVDEAYTDYDITFDLLSYKSYSDDELIQIIVRVRKDSDEPWIEKASLVRQPES